MRARGVAEGPGHRPVAAHGERARRERGRDAGGVLHGRGGEGARRREHRLADLPGAARQLGLHALHVDAPGAGQVRLREADAGWRDLGHRDHAGVAGGAEGRRGQCEAEDQVARGLGRDIGRHLRVE